MMLGDSVFASQVLPQWGAWTQGNGYELTPSHWQMPTFQRDLGERRRLTPELLAQSASWAEPI